MGDFLRSIDSWVVDRQMELTAIPAPPFGEGPRGDRFGSLLEDLGLLEVSKDEVGNVLGWYSGRESAEEQEPAQAPFVVAAHLDTVFPAETDVEPWLDGNRIHAPGISDDGRGLAAVLAMVRVMVEFGPTLPTPILFVGTVGEEGPGDLRGVRHLFGSEGAGKDALGFISLDGVGLDKIITRGVGSIRFRLTIRGTGGHSWMDWPREYRSRP